MVELGSVACNNEMALKTRSGRIVRKPTRNDAYVVDDKAAAAAAGPQQPSRTRSKRTNAAKKDDEPPAVETKVVKNTKQKPTTISMLPCMSPSVLIERLNVDAIQRRVTTRSVPKPAPISTHNDVLPEKQQQRQHQPPVSVPASASKPIYKTIERVVPKVPVVNEIQKKKKKQPEPIAKVIPITVDRDFGLLPLPGKQVKRKTSAKDQNIAPADDIYAFDEVDPDDGGGRGVAAKVKRRKVVAAPKKAFKKNPLAKITVVKVDNEAGKKKQLQFPINYVRKDEKRPVPQGPVKSQPPVPPPLAVEPAAQPKQVVQIISEEHLKTPMDLTMLGLNKNSTLNSDTSFRLVPWRFSSICHPPSPRKSSHNQSILNDSNAENQNPNPAAATAAVNPRPLANALNVVPRSPMKELNPNDSALGHRMAPPSRLALTPTKGGGLKVTAVPAKHFDVDNHFGFDEFADGDDSQWDADAADLEAEKRFINARLEELRRFRHRLTNTRNKPPRPRPALGQQQTTTDVIRNIFTSTPRQQVKIRDYFTASTPIVVAPASNKTTEPIVGDPVDPKLFESLPMPSGSPDKVAKPNRNYSNMMRRKRKRINFYGFSEDEMSEDEVDGAEEENVEQESPMTRHQPKKMRVNKQHERELNQFVTEFNSMCDEVDQYEMVTEVI